MQDPPGTPPQLYLFWEIFYSDFYYHSWDKEFLWLTLTLGIADWNVRKWNVSLELEYISSGGIALTELQLYNFPRQSNGESKLAENSPRQLISG